MNFFEKKSKQAPVLGTWEVSADGSIMDRPNASDDEKIEQEKEMLKSSGHFESITDFELLADNTCLKTVYPEELKGVEAAIDRAGSDEKHKPKEDINTLNDIITDLRKDIDMLSEKIDGNLDEIVHYKKGLDKIIDDEMRQRMHDALVTLTRRKEKCEKLIEDAKGKIRFLELKQSEQEEEEG